jgi:ATP-dependent protease ClpP protease subunit
VAKAKKTKKIKSKKDKVLLNEDGFRIVAKAGGSEAELYIYGDIGESWYGESVTAKAFIEELNGLDVDRIKVRISSYGGSVKDGIAIHNAIRRHEAANEIYIDSVAASSASLIAMAGDTVSMSENALLMIHAPWTYAIGNSAEMREAADVLDTYASAMATSYARKSGKTHEEALSLLTDGIDHYFTAEDAKAEGFVDVVLEDEEDADASAVMRSAISSRFGDGMLDFIGRDLPAIAASLSKPGPGTKRKEDKSMAKLNTKAGGKKGKKAKASAAQKPTADEQRRSEIVSLFGGFEGREGVQSILDASLLDAECTVEQARENLQAHLGTQTAPVAASVSVESDEKDKFSVGVTAALMQRAGHVSADTAKANMGSEFRGMNLRDIAARSLILGGMNAGNMYSMGREDVFKMAARPMMFGGHVTSDFANILSNVARKFMLIGHEQADETWAEWCRVVSLSDFKSHDMVGLSEFDNLDQVYEGGEYKHGSFDDYKESIQLLKWGKLFTISWEAMINDDLSAFTDIPRKMGLSAARKVGDLVYAVLTGAPLMRDGTALFDATHSNITTPGTAPSTAAVDAVRTAMGTQTGEKGVANLNISPAFMLVPKALEGRGKVVETSEKRVVVGSNSNETVPNTVRNTFRTIADSRLDVDSAVKWYMAANPNMVDTINVGFLNGQQTPDLEETQNFAVDGVEMKVRQVAQAKAADWRGLHQNVGS